MTPKDIDSFILECKKHGLNVTYPRLAIYKILLQYSGHPSAEDIFNEVKKDHPNISLATVYKTMEMLAGHNLISKVTALHDMARYDCNNDFHHHLVCTRCKKITDIDNDKLNRLKFPDDLDPDYIIESYQVQFNGICKECQRN
jgi:Fur family peroxide stress response transcriptional regulator